jgi:hypothetical protein
MSRRREPARNDRDRDRDGNTGIVPRPADHANDPRRPLRRRGYAAAICCPRRQHPGETAINRGLAPGTAVLMIRRATFDRRPAIMALIRDAARALEICQPLPYRRAALEHLVTAMIAQQGQIGPQGSCVFVAVRDGKAVGFIAGILDRVYQIGKKLVAQDLFFVNEGAVGDTLALLDEYVAWARNIRAVLEIVVSWTDTLPGAERVAQLYSRKGFIKSGEISRSADRRRSRSGGRIMSGVFKVHRQGLQVGGQVRPSRSRLMPWPLPRWCSPAARRSAFFRPSLQPWEEWYRH